MKESTASQTIKEALAKLDITINGSGPADIQVHDQAFYNRVLRDGTLGFGESYMEGLWDCQNLDQLATILVRANIGEKMNKSLRLILEVVWLKLFNDNRRSNAYDVGKIHYDVGNDLYKAMLDKRLVYTCAYWENAKTLDEAQEAKLDLVCRKIDLQPGMKVLDIGGGWGSFAQYAAERYKAKVTNISVSKEQIALANERTKGLSVENRLQDYRAVNETFDRIVSLGMFEHVGYKNYQTYMSIARRNLTDDGLFLLHTIGFNYSTTGGEPWTNKYIFPHSMLPSIKQIGAAIEHQFVMEDWHNFSADYDKTLMAWETNFEQSWRSLKEQYGERFYRMWRFYLLVSAGTFRSRTNQLWQIVLSPHGVVGGYQSIR